MTMDWYKRREEQLQDQLRLVQDERDAALRDLAERESQLRYERTRADDLEQAVGAVTGERDDLLYEMRELHADLIAKLDAAGHRATYAALDVARKWVAAVLRAGGDSGD